MSLTFLCVLNIMMHSDSQTRCEISVMLSLRANYTDRPPLWSSGQSSWLQSQRSVFNYRHYLIFWEVVGLEWDQLSLLSTIEELLGRQNSGSGLENREYGHRDPSRLPRYTLYSRKLALSLPTSSGCSVGIIFSNSNCCYNYLWCGIWVWHSY
jgi:hypothetical protein